MPVSPSVVQPPTRWQSGPVPLSSPSTCTDTSRAGFCRSVPGRLISSAGAPQAEAALPSPAGAVRSSMHHSITAKQTPQDKNSSQMTARVAHGFGPNQLQLKIGLKGTAWGEWQADGRNAVAALHFC